MFKLPNLSQPKQKVNLLIAAMFVALQLPIALVASRVAFADGNGSPTACLDTTTNVLGSMSGTESTVSVNLATVSDSDDTVPSGSTVSGVCIKSGDQTTFIGGTNGHSPVINTDGNYGSRTHPRDGIITPCYSVSGIGTSTATVTRLNENCQGISHIDVIYSPATQTQPEVGSITVIKDAQPNSSQEFTFTGNLAGDEEPNFVLVDDGDGPGVGSRLFDGLEPGTYTVTEPNNIGGYELMDVSCEGGSDVIENERGAVIKLEANENVVCTFVNVLDEEAESGSITIIKDAQPNSLQDFIFSATGIDGVTNFTLDDDAETLLVSNQRVFEELPAGDYSFTETEVEGWTLQSITCSTTEGIVVALPKVTVTLGEGDDVSCTFVNVQDEEEENGNVLGDSDTVVRTSGQVLGASTQVVAPVGGVSAGGAAGSVTGSLFGLGSSLTALGYGVASLRKRQ